MKIRFFQVGQTVVSAADKKSAVELVARRRGVDPLTLFRELRESGLDHPVVEVTPKAQQS